VLQDLGQKGIASITCIIRMSAHTYEIYRITLQIAENSATNRLSQTGNASKNCKKKKTVFIVLLFYLFFFSFFIKKEIVFYNLSIKYIIGYLSPYTHKFLCFYANPF